MPNFDLVELAIKGVCPNNTVIYDDKGYPSIMVEVPKFTYKDAGLGDSTDVLPCFKVNDQIVDSVFISKYQNIVHDNRAYSLPGVTQTSNVTFDQAIQYCANKGAGWHLMTNPEWGAIMMWCAVRGITPLGNNNWGRHASESVYTAIPADYESGKIRRIKVGTGPLSYYHDGTPSGIADLVGNVWEWVGAIRTVFGELQVLVYNNAANSTISQSATSAAWMAIKASDGSFIKPDGNGTTPGSIKMDYVSGKLQYSTSFTGEKGLHSCNFGDITCSADISTAAQNYLKAIGMLPNTKTDFTQGQWCGWDSAQAERSFFRGGSYGNADYGLPSFRGNNPRSSSYVSIGFRASYVKLPAA